MTTAVVQEEQRSSPLRFGPRGLVFVAFALACLTPWVTAPMALATGIAYAFVFGDSQAVFLKRWTSPLLQTAVVGLGAGMDLGVVLRVGARGLGYTATGITLTLLLAWILARPLGTDAVLSLLIGVGTAICGGSAIAAVAPVVRAKSEQTSVALGVVFLLNSAALLVFPRVGVWAGLSQPAFGLWSALAIHDTSSVVGAALAFGPGAVPIATTVKLARALWIVPVSLAASWLPLARSKEEHAARAKRPWFILGFVAAAAIATYVPGAAVVGVWVAAGARHLLVLTLFFIGCALSKKALQTVGWRPLALGLSLWVIVASATLAAVRSGLIVV